MCVLLEYLSLADSSLYLNVERVSLSFLLSWSTGWLASFSFLAVVDVY